MKQPLGRSKHQRWRRCIFRDMTASELDHIIDTHAELLAALKEAAAALRDNHCRIAANAADTAIAKAEGR